MVARIILVILCVGLTSCVTMPEQAASQDDLDAYARTLEGDPFADLDPDEFRLSALKMLDTDVEFYGIVVDETGEPIEDARVTASVFDHLVDPFEFPYFSFTVREPVYTDRQGRFAIEDERGAGVYVLVEVPGWAPVTTPRKLFVYAQGLSQTLPFPSRNEPAEFVFKVRPPQEELRRINTGALPFVDDGLPLEVSLRRPARYGVEPGTGEAIVSCARGIKDAAIDARFDWWCEMRIPGGGFQLVQIDMGQAPLDGYVESARLEYTADDPDWDDRADRDVIVRFADGTYGSVTISMRMDGDFYVAFDGVWNPSGSAWLD